MRLEFSPWVEGDLDAIAGYIALDSPRHAAAFLQEIRAELRVVARNPLLYRLRPKIGSSFDRMHYYWGARQMLVGIFA